MRLAHLPPLKAFRRPDRWRPALVCLLVKITAVALAFGPLALEREMFGQEKATSEYQIKAAFLFHFSQFVVWPPDAFKDATSLTYCTVGEDPFDGELERALNGKSLGARALRVQHVKEARELPGCQVLFLGITEKTRLAAVLESVKSSPVLTVGDSEHFAEQGGMIGFCREENKIRFEINLGAAARANLKISAKLLSLAKTVLGHADGVA